MDDFAAALRAIAEDCRMSAQRAHPVAGGGHSRGSMSRNRNYHLLWAGQALSDGRLQRDDDRLSAAGARAHRLASGVGLVLGVDAAAQLVAGLPAGALVDRWNRKRIMLCCEAAQGIAVASLVIALW